MQIITSKGRCFQVKQIMPFEEIEYKVGGVTKHDYAPASSVEEANGLVFILDVDTLWFTPHFIIGNLPPELVREIINVVMNGKTYDFTEFTYQEALECSEVSMKSVKPWVDEITFVPLDVVQKLYRSVQSCLTVPTIAPVDFMNPPIVDEGEEDDCFE